MRGRYCRQERALRLSRSMVALAAEEGAQLAGPSAGRAIGETRFRAALQEYYELRGSDENGVPSGEKLDELGIDWRPGS